MPAPTDEPTSDSAAPASGAAAAPASAGRGTDRAILVLFVVALAVHGFCVTRNWSSGFLIGHEFRQTQTALITRYIDEQNNFSLRYETPLFGKPWVAPLELPLYEWLVVAVKRATGWPPHEAARLVSVTFFYLLLPGLYVLLGEVGLPPRRRLLALVFTLLCPVYLFYTRAFLMESFVLCAAVWFLAAFVRGLRTRRVGWLALAATCGAAAGVAKSLTLLVWLVPAAAYAAWCLGREWRAGGRGSSLARTAAWALVGGLVPLGATLWWIRFTDAIKAAHPSAHIFTSREMSTGNFGLFDLGARFDGEMWRQLLVCWDFAVMPRWWLVAAVAAGVALAGRWRRAVLGAAGLWLGAQLLLPYAYALQDYYFYAATVFVTAALGLAAHGALESRRFAMFGWIWLAAVVGGGGWSYLQPGGYWRQQRFWTPGGDGLTDALRATTPPGGVLVVAGADWSAIIPYYSHRRALMIRNGLEYDAAYLERAFADLADEPIGALVLVGPQRNNRPLVERAAAQFQTETEPTFQHPNADVYVNQLYREKVLGHLAVHNQYHGVTTTQRPSPRRPPDALPTMVGAPTARAAFPLFRPGPARYRFPFGYATWPVDGVDVIQAHAPTDVWIEAPAVAATITWEFGMMPKSYERDGEKTNGAEFIVAGESAAGWREIFKRRLNPAEVPADRGTQREEIAYTPRAQETLVFMTRPYGPENFDWCYFKRIEVQ